MDADVDPEARAPAVAIRSQAGRAGRARTGPDAGTCPETQRPRRSGVVGKHMRVADGQSSPLDMSSSATTSAAAHSRASRSLRSRSDFSTASM